MKLYFIAYDEREDREGGGEDNYDWFVAAPTALAAFVAWRKYLIDQKHIDLQEGGYDETTVRVFPVPTRHVSRTTVLDWDHEHMERFPMTLDSLASKALEQEQNHAAKTHRV